MWWRLGLRAPPVTRRNYSLTIFFFFSHSIGPSVFYLWDDKQFYSRRFSVHATKITIRSIILSHVTVFCRGTEMVFTLWLLLTRSPSLTLRKKPSQHVHWNPPLKSPPNVEVWDGFNTTANHTKKSNSRRPQILSERKASFYLFYFLTCLTALTPKTKRAQTSISFYCESGLTGSSI